MEKDRKTEKGKMERKKELIITKWNKLFKPCDNMFDYKIATDNIFMAFINVESFQEIQFLY